jgi:hypothetical protein
MPSIFDNFLRQVVTGDNIKDYKHASRLFVDNNYERSPKYTWLFHVYFDLNPELTKVNQRNQIEAGMLVKSADLPKFKIDSKIYNNYNRPSIAQTKVRYEDINITFHDDSANLVRKLWFDYYNFYYRDADINYGDATGALNPLYLKNYKQTLGQRKLLNNFGYTPRRNSNISTQYIQAIRIYSLHQKRFSEYTLINPIITSYRHGTHQNGQDSTMENVMTISYETVLYAGGSASVARGFADLHYDRSPSPLTVAGGGTNSILGPGGIVNALDEVITDGSDRKWGSSAFKAVRAYQTNKNVDFRNLASQELLQGFNNVLRGGNLGSALNQTYIPYRGVDANNGTGFQSALSTQGTAGSGSVNSNGFNITQGAPTVTNSTSGLVGNPVSPGSISGVISTGGTIVGTNVNKVTNLAKGPNNQLTATSSGAIPTNSFASLINSANDSTRNKALANDQKALQESSNSSSAFFNSRTFSPSTTSFRTGTNEVVSSVGPLSQTPSRDLQFAADAEVSSSYTARNLSSPNVPSLDGKTSTNPAPTA